jgi:hypothetical protein
MATLTFDLFPPDVNTCERQAAYFNTRLHLRQRIDF